VEWWTFEALILMAGWLPNAKVTLAAAGIGINTVGGLLLLRLRSPAATPTQPRCLHLRPSHACPAASICGPQTLALH
jgi:hypothetical protein